MLRLRVICICIALMLVACANSSEEKMIDFIVGDIDEDGEEELILINALTAKGELESLKDYGSHLEIYEEYEVKEDRVFPKGKAAYSFDLSGIKPFELQLGDIADDDQNEISIKVFKSTKFHKVEAERPFFYKLSSGNLEPVWLGSRLSRPFEDFILMDPDDDDKDEIIAIEVLEDGSKILAKYDWKSFGFELTAESEPISKDIFFIKEGPYKKSELRVDDKAFDIVVEGEALKLIEK